MQQINFTVNRPPSLSSQTPPTPYGQPNSNIFPPTTSLFQTNRAPIGFTRPSRPHHFDLNDFPVLGESKKELKEGVESARRGFAIHSENIPSEDTITKESIYKPEGVSYSFKEKEKLEYGLSGLLASIKNDINSLSIGTDLTNLGFNLNSSDPLYTTFGSPFSNTPLARDFSMPKDALQVFAAKELYTRDWRYHKDSKLWFKLLPESNLKGSSYMYFDITTWERRSFHDTSGLKFMDETEIRNL